MSPVRVISLNDTARLLFGRIASEDPRRRRVLGILQSVVTSLGGRVVGMLISFLSVPLTIGYLGPERYGAWVSIGSVLAWLRLSDLGLSNGLTNAVTTAAGEDRPDVVQMHLSNGLLMMAVVGTAAGLIALAAWPFIDWNALLGVTSPEARAEVGPAVAVALVAFLLSFPLGMAGKVYLAYQEAKIGNYWGMAGNFLTLAALLTVVHTQGGLVWLAVALSGTPVLMGLAGNLYVFLVRHPHLRPGLRHVRSTAMRPLAKVGSKFFLIGIMALVVFETDNLVISHYLGAAEVPQYSLTYTLFSYTSLPQNLVFTFLWAAYTEAIARKDIGWVSRAFHLNLWLGMAFTAAGVAVLVFLTKPFIEWWAGAAVVPSTALVLWMAAWSMINSWTSPIACLLASASHLRNQLIYSGFSTVSNAVLSIVLVQRWGVEGVIAATVISYIIFVCGPTYIDVERLLGRLRRAV